MKRKMLCIILILIITTLFCGVSFASREGELKEGIGQKENEIEQIKKEKDEISLKRLENINKELETLKVNEKELTESWNKEKEINENIKKIKSEIDKKRFELEQAESRYDLENAAKLRHGVIPELEKELKELKEKSDNMKNKQRNYQKV